ncbi:ATP-binding protein [Salipiger pacificus]|uniref:ATP-binding protein n=1 Tax=Salipiger mangrovisoli TaxID=2865933 RepID=A0ABR9X6M5_9RHOB|nr:ATP-binding protein [Salipiger mangrovisoli]
MRYDLHAGTAGTSSRALYAEFTSSTAEVRRVLQRVRGVLDKAGLCRGARDNIELVLAEALNNVAEHAYDAKAPGLIRLCLSLRPGIIGLELRDRGRPMPNLVLPEGRFKPLGGGGDLPEGGFGWFLIRRLSAHVTYRREGGENVLEILMPGRPDSAFGSAY